MRGQWVNIIKKRQHVSAGHWTFSPFILECPMTSSHLVKWGHLWSSVPPIISNGFEFDRHLGQDFSARSWLIGYNARHYLYLTDKLRPHCPKFPSFVYHHHIACHMFLSLLLFTKCFSSFIINFYKLVRKKETAYLVPKAAITYYHKLEAGGRREVLETEVHSLTL